MLFGILCRTRVRDYEAGHRRFNSRYTAPQPPDPDESFIDEESISLHCDHYHWSIASYEIEINDTDFPGRVELTFQEPE
jgi:hypothetical protein